MMTERSDMDLPDGGKSYKLVAEGAESTCLLYTSDAADE